MLDDLRNSAASSYQDDVPEIPPDQPEPSGSRRRAGGPFLGMTAVQRFVLVLMILIMTCVLGSFCLLLTGKVWLPFWF